MERTVLENEIKLVELYCNVCGGCESIGECHQLANIEVCEYYKNLLQDSSSL